MKRSRALVTSTCALALMCLLSPSVAHAANTTCVNADYVFLGERAQYFAAASSSLFFKTRVTAGRSYAVIAWGPFQDTGEGGVSLSVNLFSNETCTTSVAGSDAGDYEPFVFGIIGHSSDHDNVIPAADGTVYVQVSNTEITGYIVHTLVIETTLFSPWWFTGGTNQAYVEVRNNMTGSTTARLTLYRANGTVCGNSDIVVAGNGNAAVEVNGIGSCGIALSGSAQIAFAGTPGGMTANITTINVPNGTSFDAAFTPRMVWSMTGR